MKAREQLAGQRRAGIWECTAVLTGAAMIAVTMAGCGGNGTNRTTQASSDTAATATVSGGAVGTATAQHVAPASGFNAPEALIYDPVTDFYYVSNVAGAVGVKPGRGFISRVRPDGTMDSLHFIQGGTRGVTLNGPMGSRVRGGTLYVLDIDVLRTFNLRTGKSLGTIDFSRLHPHILNDFDWGPDGAIYATVWACSPIRPGNRSPGRQCAS